MRTAEEKREAATAATRRWRAKNPNRPLTPEQREKARERYRRWQERNPGKHTPYDPQHRARHPWARVLGVRQAHAKKRGIPFALKVADARAVWTGRCAVTGLPFDLRLKPGKKGPRPFSPSLDRIRPEVGYVSGNIRFVLQCVNAFRSTMSDSLMKKVAAKILESDVVCCK
jgi:hypothetical protein